MKIHAWWMDVWCWAPCGRLQLCCVLSYSLRLPRRTWPTLSWSWSSPTGQPRASPPARSTRRSSSRRTSCNPASYLISATPVIYETLDTKSLFLYSHSCLLCGGSPFPQRGMKLLSAKSRGRGPLDKSPRTRFSGSEPWRVRTLILRPFKRIFCWAKPLYVFFLLYLFFFNLNFNLLPFLYLWYQAHSI